MRSAGAQSAAAPAPQSTVTADVNELPLEGPSNYPTVLAALEPTSTAKQNAQPQPAIQPGATYLEVGSFNDALWADNAVTKLSQLGFSALAVHKTHLWAQSYHVQVGPYETLAELETAEQQLSAKGFKPRAVK